MVRSPHARVGNDPQLLLSYAGSSIGEYCSISPMVIDAVLDDDILAITIEAYATCQRPGIEPNMTSAF